MSLGLGATILSAIPVTALVSLTLAGMKREEPAAILKVALRNWAYLVGGLVVLGVVLQIISAAIH
ncbi:MAG: hypothetical protein ACYTGX_09565 [Planctomycetota bacterium]|jgi:hypothetical protein